MDHQNREKRSHFYYIISLIVLFNYSKFLTLEIRIWPVWQILLSLMHLSSSSLGSTPGTPMGNLRALQFLFDFILKTHPAGCRKKTILLGTPNTPRAWPTGCHAVAISSYERHLRTMPSSHVNSKRITVKIKVLLRFHAAGFMKHPITLSFGLS